MTTTAACPCACHTGSPCTITGGCAHLHTTCIIRGEQLGDDEHGRYACHRCTEHHRRLLREIELYLTELPAMTTVDRDHDPHVDDDEPRQYLWGEIHSLCRMLAEEREERDPGAAVWYLLVHADWAAHRPWFDEHHQNIRELHAELHCLAHDTPPGPFATCNQTGCTGDVYWVRDQEITDDSGTRKLDCGRCATCGTCYYGARLVKLQLLTTK